MKKLRQLQNDMLKGLVGGEGRLILPGIKVFGRLSNEQRVRIYKNSMREGLVKVLTDVFRICNKLVGKEFFDAMARLYVRQTLSRSPDLNDYGKDFSEFINTFPPAESLPYLSDVAKLEWAWHEAYRGDTNVEDFDIELLSKISEANQGNIVFDLPHSSTLIESLYPLLRIWEINQEDYSGDEQIDLSEGGVKLLVWRHNDEMHLDEVSDHLDWHILKAITNQSTLLQLSGGVDEDELAALTSRLQKLVKRGWVRGFHLK